MINLNIGNLNQECNQPLINLQFQRQELNQLFWNLDLLQNKGSNNNNIEYNIENENDN